MLSGTGADENHSRSDRRSEISRRRVLAGIAGGTALLAGCGSGDSGTATETPAAATPTRGVESPNTDPTATPTATGPEPIETTFDLRANWTFSADWDVSPYSSNTPAENYAIAPTLTPFGGLAGHPELEYRPLLMEENELVDNEVWRQTLAEGFTWHDGEPVTIEDRYARAKYDNLFKTKMDRDPEFERVEIVEDRTLEQTLIEKRHPIRFHGARRPLIAHKASVYEPHLESLTDATSSREAFQIHKALKAVSIPPAEWVGHGMFEVADVSDERVLLTRYEDYPLTPERRQNFERVRVPIRLDESTRSELVGSNTTDWFQDHHGIDSIPDNYRNVGKRTAGQRGYRLNHANKHLKRRGVRRAMAYRQSWGHVVADHISHNPDFVQDGTTPYVGNQWVPDYDERTQNYIEYGKFPEQEKASAELEREGYERNTDERWVGPDGDLLEITVTDFTGTDFNGMLAEWLDTFGITTEATTIGGADGTWASYEGDWDVMYMPHGTFVHNPSTTGELANHPSMSYENEFRWGLKMTTEEDGKTVPAGNRDLEYELPTELGATDLTGATETIDVPELQAKISDPEATAEDLVEPTRTLSWWWNFYQPDRISYNLRDYFWADYGNLEWADWNGDGEGDALSPHEVSYSLHTGHVRSKEV